jgi:uncharacterized protein (TIGR03066 family)
MTTRLLALPAILVALFAVSGCNGTSETPQAPEPRSKGEKTKAELLVGTWKLVKRTPPNSKGSQMTFEYTKNGEVTLWKDNPLDGREIQMGTYRLEGDTLSLMMDADPKERNVTIDSITEDRLVTSGFSGSTPISHEYERVREK